MSIGRCFNALTRGVPVISAIVLQSLAAQVAPMKPVESIASVDLARYAGRWYEVAKFPNRFQKACVRGTVAEYTVLPSGDLRVVNQCTQADGTVKVAEGRAKLAHRGGKTSQLKVRFAPAILSWLSAVWGDYWVLDLTDDYRAVLVGSPDRQYLWILSRTAELDSATYDRMVASATAQGFDVARLVKSPP